MNEDPNQTGNNFQHFLDALLKKDEKLIAAKDETIATKNETIATLKSRLDDKDKELAAKEVNFNLMSVLANKAQAEAAHQLGKIEATFVSRIILEFGASNKYPGPGYSTTKRLELLWEDMWYRDEYGNHQLKPRFLKYVVPLRKALLFQLDRLRQVSMKDLMDHLSRSHHTPSPSVAGFYIGGPNFEPEFAAALCLCCLSLAMDDHHHFSPLKVLNKEGHLVCSIYRDEIDLSSSDPSGATRDASRAVPSAVADKHPRSSRMSDLPRDLPQHEDSRVRDASPRHRDHRDDRRDTRRRRDDDNHSIECRSATRHSLARQEVRSPKRRRGSKENEESRGRRSR